MHEGPYLESVPSTADYTEPLNDMYFKLNTVSTDNDSKEQIMESGLSRSRERGTCDEDTAIEQSSVSTNYEYYKGTHQYYHLKDCPLVNSEQPLETDKGTCGNCNSKEDSNSSKPTYFVLKAVEVNISYLLYTNVNLFFNYYSEEKQKKKSKFISYFLSTLYRICMREIFYYTASTNDDKRHW